MATCCTHHLILLAAGTDAVAAAAVAVVIGLGISVVHLRGIPGQTRPHQQIGAQARTLRDAFNADIGTVRVLALVSPTCGACLRGAADLQHHVFAPVSDARLRGYLVWVPKLDGHEADVDQATHTVPDPRVPDGRGTTWRPRGLS